MGGSIIVVSSSDEEEDNFGGHDPVVIDLCDTDEGESPKQSDNPDPSLSQQPHVQAEPRTGVFDFVTKSWRDDGRDSVPVPVVSSQEDTQLEKDTQLAIRLSLLDWGGSRSPSHSLQPQPCQPDGSDAESDSSMSDMPMESESPMAMSPGPPLAKKPRISPAGKNGRHTRYRDKSPEPKPEKNISSRLKSKLEEIFKIEPWRKGSPFDMEISDSSEDEEEKYTFRPLFLPNLSASKCRSPTLVPLAKKMSFLKYEPVCSDVSDFSDELPDLDSPPVQTVDQEVTDKSLIMLGDSSKKTDNNLEIIYIDCDEQGDHNSSCSKDFTRCEDQRTLKKSCSPDICQVEEISEVVSSLTSQSEKSHCTCEHPEDSVDIAYCQKCRSNRGQPLNVKGHSKVVLNQDQQRKLTKTFKLSRTFHRTLSKCSSSKDSENSGCRDTANSSGSPSSARSGNYKFRHFMDSFAPCVKNFEVDSASVASDSTLESVTLYPPVPQASLPVRRTSASSLESVTPYHNDGKINKNCFRTGEEVREALVKSPASCLGEVYQFDDHHTRGDSLTSPSDSDSTSDDDDLHGPEHRKPRRTVRCSNFRMQSVHMNHVPCSKSKYPSSQQEYGGSRIVTPLCKWRPRVISAGPHSHLQHICTHSPNNVSNSETCQTYMVQKFSDAIVHTIEACQEEGAKFDEQAAFLVRDFTTHTREPSDKILRYLLSNVLMKSEEKMRAYHIYQVLNHVQNSHTRPMAKLSFKWEDLKQAITSIKLPARYDNVSSVTVLSNVLAVQYMVSMIEQDFQNCLTPPITQEKLRKSFAFSVLSENNFQNIRQIVQWISHNLTFDEYEEITSSFLRLNLKSMLPPKKQATPSVTLQETPKMLPLLEKLLELSLVVSSCPDSCAKRIAVEMVPVYLHAPSLYHRWLLLTSITAPLLRFKLTQRLLEDHCGNNNYGCSGGPICMEDIITNYFEYEPVQNLLTPPPTPSDDEDVLEGDEIKRYPEESCEELAMLLWNVVDSYIACTQGRLQDPTFKRLQMGVDVEGVPLKSFDRKTLSGMSGYVAKLRERLNSLTHTLTAKTHLYLVQLECLGSLGKR